MIDRAITRSGDSVAEVLRDVQLRRLWVVAVVVQLLDALTTAAGLSVGLPENNPFTVRVLTAYGSAGLLLQKMVIVGVVLVALARVPRRTATAAICLLTALSAVVVGANLQGLLSAA